MWNNIEEYKEKVNPFVKSDTQLRRLPDHYHRLFARIEFACRELSRLREDLLSLEKHLEVANTEGEKTNTKEINQLVLSASLHVEESMLYFQPFAELDAAVNAIAESKNFKHLEAYSVRGAMTKYVQCLEETVTEFKKYDEETRKYVSLEIVDISNCKNVPVSVMKKLKQAQDLSSVDQYEMAAFCSFIALEILVRSIVEPAKIEVKRKNSDKRLHEMAFHELIDYLPNLRWVDTDDQFLTQAESSFLIYLKEYRNDLAHLGESGDNLDGNKHYHRLMEQSVSHIGLLWRRSEGGTRTVRDCRKGSLT